MKMAHVNNTRTAGLFLAVVLVLMTLVGISNCQPHMDITAYEYHRKFHKTLTLGECPFRQVAVKNENGTEEAQGEKCNLRKQGDERRITRVLNNNRIEQITSTQEVVASLGLCGAEAAVYLGILYEGECVAIDIASRLTFSDKTVVRAFIGYYTTALDILDTTKENIRDGVEIYFKNKYYVKTLYYGTQEVILVQFRFRNRSLASLAAAYKPTEPKMSAYMEAVRKHVGDPKSVRIISLSTMSKENFKVETKTEWTRALRYVQILELKIQNRQDSMKNTEVSQQPHLKYDLYPFVDTDEDKTGTGRTVKEKPNQIEWQTTSMMEVQLRQTMHLVKKMNKKCKENTSKECNKCKVNKSKECTKCKVNKSKECTKCKVNKSKECTKCKENTSQECDRVRELRRELRTKQREVHRGRSAWVTMTPEEKKSFIQTHQSKVETYARFAKQLSRSVKRMIRRQKLEKLTRKRNKATNPNEIPPAAGGSTSSRRQHRVRHSRWKVNRRKGKKKNPKLKPRYKNLGWF